VKTPPDIAILCARVLAAHPNAPFADQWLPLQVGVRQILVDRGVLDADETNKLLRWWCGRAGYNLACVAGAARIGIDGEPAGRVTAEEAAHSLKKLRSGTASQRAWDAALAKAREIRLAREKAGKAPQSPANGAPSAELSTKARSSLRDLRAAAIARKVSSSSS
jgi:ProP effector